MVTRSLMSQRAFSRLILQKWLQRASQNQSRPFVRSLCSAIPSSEAVSQSRGSNDNLSPITRKSTATNARYDFFRQSWSPLSIHRRLFSSDKQHSPGTQSSQEDEGEAEAQIPICLAPYTGLPSHPDSIELLPGQRLVAIGDVHGDFDQLLSALLIAGVVAEEDLDNDEEEGRSFVWVGGNTILVQIGDILDRGPAELQCWQLLADLARQAQVVDGAVIFLYGNHELWTSVGFYQLDHERYIQNLDYDDGIDDEFELEFGEHLELSIGESEEDWRHSRTLHQPLTQTPLLPLKVAARWAAMEPGGILAKDFLSNFKIAIKVGGTILVHAGIVPEHLTRFGGIKGMNEATKRWILKKGPRVGRQHMLVPPNDSEGRMRTYLQSMPDFFMEGDDNDYSPIWMRDYSDPPDQIPHNANAPQMLDEVLTKLEASRVVIGHTPQSQINAIHKGKAWRIDVGMSRGMNANTAEVLEVTKTEEGQEDVWILTPEGRIPAEERYVICEDQEHPASEDGS